MRGVLSPWFPPKCTVPLVPPEKANNKNKKGFMVCARDEGFGVLLPVLEFGVQGFGSFGLDGGEVPGFAEVFTEVVEFEVMVLEELDELPIAAADGALHGVFTHTPFFCLLP